MRLRLWHRLFLAFAALSVLALLAFALWQQRAFHEGFLAYLDQVALDRLQSSTGRFAAAYREHGDFAFLRGDPRRFDALLDGRDDAPVEPPREPRPPPFDDGRPPPPRGGPRPPPGGPHHLALVDADDRFVAGDPRVDAGAHVLPIEVDGRRVGALRVQPLPRISGAQDLAFAQDQARGALLAVLVVLVGAFAAAFLLARWLLAPVRALAEGTHALAAGDFARRVDASRRDELGALAADFNRLAASLEQHREARRRWGADIAHELRTPLSILRGEVQALQDGVRAPSERAFASLDAECGRLASLVEDLYQLALADAGALEYRFEPMNLAALVRDVAEPQRALCEDAGLRLELSVAPVPPLSGDARRLAQLLDNLLANARRYTDAPGTVRVALAAGADGLLLAVEDSAPGVAPEHLPRLFERLYRVDPSRRRADGGAGLGLAICRAIVEAHGGGITASRSTLGGLRIEVRLPSAGGRPA
ncbi:ATP-binding protein [Dokdonella sp.]|uniref:ATP-binding protein n=1 Tax=Dokdonella sp. TaxID=2291710 RepID=UPI001B1F4521|nr:ATP-binding protein [Dokdonella sp.]MBO9663300.1 HAMP domain-containing protein [Dokdonella sp.]